MSIITSQIMDKSIRWFTACSGRQHRNHQRVDAIVNSYWLLLHLDHNVPFYVKWQCRTSVHYSDYHWFHNSDILRCYSSHWNYIPIEGHSLYWRKKSNCNYLTSMLDYLSSVPKFCHLVYQIHKRQGWMEHLDQNITSAANTVPMGSHKPLGIYDNRPHMFGCRVCL